MCSYRGAAIHRLDKLTSGLVMLCRTSELASRFMSEVQRVVVHKEYVARVLGEFPADEVNVDQPIAVIDKAQGRHAVHPSGKAAQTIFQRLSYNGHTSAVLCRPITGRTHQIRVHLQWLGFPIANDSSYGGGSFVSNTFSNMYGMQDEMRVPLPPRHTPPADDAASAASASSDAPAIASPRSAAVATADAIEIPSAATTGVSLQALNIAAYQARLDFSACVHLAPARVAAMEASASTSTSTESLISDPTVASGSVDSGDKDGHTSMDAMAKGMHFPTVLPPIPLLRDMGTSYDPGCGTCQSGSYWNDFTRYPGLIWLHARRYACPELKFDFAVPDPKWAAADYDSVAALAQPVLKAHLAQIDAVDDD